MTRVLAVVLTGGASRRMGADKATLVVEGRRLVDNAVAVMHEAGIDDIVIAGPDPGDLVRGHGTIAVVPDPAGPRQGPLSGLAAAWRHVGDQSAFDIVVVVSCDLPWLTSSVIVELIAAASQHEFGAQAFDGERAQPLVAAYRTPTVDVLANRFDEGERSVRRILQNVNLALVSFDRSIIRDVDEPSDLDGVQVTWPSAPPGE